MKKRLLMIVAGIVVLCVPVIITNTYYLHILITMGIYSILAVSLNLIFGYGGQFSMGHAAFCGLGAYATAILMASGVNNFWLGVLCSVLVSAAAGLLIGFSSARLSGDYFGIVTLGFGEIIRQILINWTSFTKGPMGISGIPGPSIGGHELTEKWEFYYLILAFLVVTVFISKKVVNSGIGLKLALIREDELAARSIGINPAKEKLFIIVLGCALAGAAGACYAVYSGYIYPSSFQYADSMTILAMVVLGGMANINGSLLGAAILTVIPELLRPIDKYRLVLYGAVLIIMMIFKPQGIWGESRRKLNTYGQSKL